MKKLITLLIGLFLLTNIQVLASDIEVQPTIFSRSIAQDRVWVGTFQLVWNDFMDKIVHNPVRFREGNPTLVKELNRQSFTVNDISENCYYKYAGKVKKDTKKQIAKAIRKKFKESSDILDKLDLTPRADMFVIYAMLKKDFEFINAFDKLGRSSFGEDSIAEYFGIGSESNKALGKGVEVLFYNDSNDYAVKLSTVSSDEIYLYKNGTNKAFNLLYSDMHKKKKAFTGDTSFNKADELKVPNISLFEEKVFEELTNRRIMGTNLVINQAMETIKFDMNYKGIKLKSEAAMTVMTTSLLPPEEIVPRLFYFDDTFVIFLKEKEKKRPYFALRVNDITKFQNK